MELNNFVLSRDQFKTVDSIIRKPNLQQLTARKYIKAHKVPSFANEFSWKYQASAGKAILATNRQTDTPTIDLSIHQETVPIVEFTAGFDYSVIEVGRTNQAGFDLLGASANAVKRLLAEFENRLLFNGLDITNTVTDGNLYGLTSDHTKAGYQTSESPIKFADATSDDGAQKLRNWLQDSLTKITTLPGFSGAKPILLLPPDKISLLDRPYNKYSPESTAYKMVSNFFKSIEPVPELSKQYTNSGEDMGIIMVNDPDVVEFADAMRPFPLNPIQQEGGVTKQQYMQRTGGLILYQPEAIVQLTNI